METSTMINQLKYEAERNKNNSLFTGQTNITALCNDVIPKLEKLEEYENAEEEGILLRLPCKVGAKVYEVFYDELNNPQYYIYKYEIEDVSVKAIKYADDWISWEELNDVYFDRKEAEKRLRELLEGTC